MSFRPAALNGLHASPQNRHRFDVKITQYRNLCDDDVKRLVRVLQGVPFPSTPDAEEAYFCNLKKQIHELPPRLRSSSRKTNATEYRSRRLCNDHQCLCEHLIRSIWRWIRHELDNGIGRFIYPIIMYGGLTKHQEWKVRQLEPVLQMYHTDYTLEASTPPGREPIATGFLEEQGRWVPKFAYQSDGCPACMLARIGSDAGALSALLSGLVARYSTKHVGHRDEIRSKRVRFVRHWLQACTGRQKLFDEAFDLGREMRRLWKAWRSYSRSRREDVLGSRNGSASPRESRIPIDVPNAFDRNDRSANAMPDGAVRLDSTSKNPRESHIDVDISGPFIPASSPPAAACPPPPPPPPPIPCSPTSLYSRTTGGATLVNHCNLGRATSSRIPAIPQQHPDESQPREVPGLTSRTVLSYAHSVGSYKGRYSIASSDSDNSWNNLASYDSRHSAEFEGDTILHPAPLRLSNTSREQAREDMMLLRPHAVSIYGAFGNPFATDEDEEDKYADDLYDVSGLAAALRNLAGADHAFRKDTVGRP